MDRHVATVVTELVELIGSQSKLARRLKISQASISRFMSGEQTPKLPQWEKIIALSVELRGWRRGSIDERLMRYDEQTQEHVRNVVDQILRDRDRTR